MIYRWRYLTFQYHRWHLWMLWTAGPRDPRHDEYYSTHVTVLTSWKIKSLNVCFMYVILSWCMLRSALPSLSISWVQHCCMENCFLNTASAFLRQRWTRLWRLIWWTSPSSKQNCPSSMRTVNLKLIAEHCTSLYQFFMENNLQSTFSEIVSLLKILMMTAMTTAESERCFSSLKRIKTFLRSSIMQDCLSALAMLSTERKPVRDTPDLNKRVIEKSAMQKERRAKFLYKWTEEHDITLICISLSSTMFGWIVLRGIKLFNQFTFQVLVFI